jgi:glutathione S-transferase
MPKIVLYQFPPVPGIPSMSPFCIKVQMAFKHKGLDFEIINTVLAKRHNPRGKLPFVIWDGETIEDSSAILQAIDERTSGPALVPDDPRLAAEVRLLEDWADESLYWHGVFAKCADPEAWKLYKGQLAAAMPAIMRPLGPRMVLRDMLGKLRGHGLLRRSPELVQSEYEGLLDALSVLLGDRTYLVGDALSTADLAVVAQFLPLLNGATPKAQALIEARPALVDHIARVCADTGVSISNDTGRDAVA